MVRGHDVACFPVGVATITAMSSWPSAGVEARGGEWSGKGISGC